MSRTAESPLMPLMCRSQGCAIARRDRRDQALEHVAQIADERDVDRHVLVDLRRVDLDVDLLARSARRCCRLPVTRSSKRMPAAISRSASWIAMVHPGFAVHAHHADVQRMRRRQAADPEQRHRDGNLRALGERPQLVHRARDQDAVTGEDHRPLALR